MSKIDTVRAAMMQAMKDKNKERKDALSLLLSALKSKQIDKRADLTEEEENAVIFREIKQAQETIDTTPADRVQTIEEARLRMQVYGEFAPKLTRFARSSKRCSQSCKSNSRRRRTRDAL